MKKTKKRKRCSFCKKSQKNCSNNSIWHTWYSVSYVPNYGWFTGH